MTEVFPCEADKNMTRSRKMMEKTTLVLALALAGAGVTKAAPPAEVQPILKESGVRGGLIVHLGCGDGKLTVALHADDFFIKPLNLERLERRIAELLHPELAVE